MLNQMKGLLETSFVDWPGKIVSVVFFSHCNFCCPYCHNHDLLLNPEKYDTISPEFILSRLDDLKGWIDGVCITGGEPTLHAILPEVIQKFRAKNFLIKLDTNGTSPGVLQDLLSDKLIDSVSMDVKGPLDEIRYSRCSGAPVNLNSIKESIQILKESGVQYELRTTVVPSLLSENDIMEMAEQLKSADKFTLQNFNPSNSLDQKLRHEKPYDEDTLKRLQGRVTEIISDSPLFFA